MINFFWSKKKKQEFLMRMDAMEFNRALTEVGKEAVAKALMQKDKLCKAFISETGLLPSECVMIHQHQIDGSVKIWFEKRSDI